MVRAIRVDVRSAGGLEEAFAHSRDVNARSVLVDEAGIGHGLPFSLRQRLQHPSRRSGNTNGLVEYAAFWRFLHTTSVSRFKAGARRSREITHLRTIAHRL